MLTDAALEGKTDRLLGLKENVIIGKLIPAATGLRRYRRLEIEPSEPVPRPSPEEIGPARRAGAGGRAGPHRLRPRGLRLRRRRRGRRRLRRRAGRPRGAAAGRRQGVGRRQSREHEKAPDTGAFSYGASSHCFGWSRVRDLYGSQGPTGPLRPTAPAATCQWPPAPIRRPSAAAAPRGSSVMPTAASVCTSSVGALRSVGPGSQRSSRCRRSRRRAGRRRTRRSPRASSARSRTRRGRRRSGRAGSRQLEQVGEVLVRLLLPAGRPDELEAVGEPLKARARSRCRCSGGSRPPSGSGPGGSFSGGKPNRLMTPSTSTNRIGRSCAILLHFVYAASELFRRRGNMFTGSLLQAVGAVPQAGRRQGR